MSLLPRIASAQELSAQKEPDQQLSYRQASDILDNHVHEESDRHLSDYVQWPMMTFDWRLFSEFFGGHFSHYMHIYTYMVVIENFWEKFFGEILHAEGVLEYSACIISRHQ